MSTNGAKMDQIAIDDVAIGLRIEGDEAKPALVLSHMLGTDLTLWDDLAPTFAEHFRVVRYDMRGHGGSGLGTGALSVDRLGRDVLAILDYLGVERAHFCGISMGGAVGLWLLTHAPDRFERAVIAGSGPKLGAPESWNARISEALSKGMEQAVATTVERWFSAAFIERAPDEVEAVRDLIRATPPEGYAACCAALRDMDLREAVRGVARPVLLMRGADDPSATAEETAHLVEVMPGATSLEFDARHCCAIEAKAAFAAAVIRFLTARTVPRRTAGRRPVKASARSKPAARRIGGRGIVAARRPVAKTTPVSGKAVAKASATRKTAARTTARSTAVTAHRRGAAKAGAAAAKSTRTAEARKASGARTPPRKAAESATTRSKVAPARRVTRSARPSPARAKTTIASRVVATKTRSVPVGTRLIAKAKTPPLAKRPASAAKSSSARAKSAPKISGKPVGKSPSKAVQTGRLAVAKASTIKRPATKATHAKATPAKAAPAKAAPAKPPAARRVAPAVKPRPSGRGPGGSGRRKS